MGNARANKFYRSFIGGLITEASALNYPENSSYDEANFVLNRDGSRYRRLGVDVETLHQFLSDPIFTEANFRDKVVTTFEWQATAGDGNLNYWVVQIAHKLFFFDLNAASITLGKHTDEIDLTSYQVGSDDPGLFECQFSTGKGLLFVNNKVTDPLYIEYDEVADSFTVTVYSVQVRDTSGIDDGLALDETPTTLSPEHEYNLYNQGWWPGSFVIAGTTTPGNPVDKYYTDNSKYPSNSMIAYYGKITNSATATEIDKWSTLTLEKNLIGSVTAPKGHYIIDVFNKDYSSVSGVAAITPVVENYRPITSAFYAGRIWLAGTDSKNLNGTLFFSQILESNQNIGKFYQDADPTSEYISDLVATDGGTIEIPEIGQVHKLLPIGNFLVIFASNGVWVVGGTDGFKADDHYVQKVTNLGALNASSIVVAEGIPFYWSDGGIYLLQPDNVSGKLNAKSITLETIQTYFNEEIPSAARAFVRGIYDEGNKRIFWYYNGDPNYTGNEFANHYNRAIIFDVALQAFYPYVIEELDIDNPPYIVSVGATSTRTRSALNNSVIDSSNNNVVTNSGNNIITQTYRAGTGRSTQKLLIVYPNDTWQVTVGEYNNTTFHDFMELDALGIGANYTSFLETGFVVEDDIMRNKQVPKITTVFNKTETGYIDDGSGGIDLNNQSSCWLQARWNWHTTASGYKWSTARQAYRHTRNYIPAGIGSPYDDGRSVVITNNRVRGSGKALQLRFSSEEGKDMQLLGWMIAFEGRTNV